MTTDEIEAKFQELLSAEMQDLALEPDQEAVSAALGSMQPMERRLLREHFAALGLYSPAHRAIAAMIH